MNWTLPGLQLYYRDTELPGDLDQLAEAYRSKNIIRAGFFIDCTSRAAKPVKRIRFIIASAHAAAIWKVMGDEEIKQWRLNILDFNSYFKVVDTYRVGEQLQIFLLHIPLKGLPMFVNMGSINLGDEMDLVKIARKSFDDKLKMEPLPWLESEAGTKEPSCCPELVPMDGFRLNRYTRQTDRWQTFIMQFSVCHKMIQTLTNRTRIDFS